MEKRSQSSNGQHKHKHKHQKIVRAMVYAITQEHNGVSSVEEQAEPLTSPKPTLNLDISCFPSRPTDRSALDANPRKSLFYHARTWESAASRCPGAQIGRSKIRAGNREQSGKQMKRRKKCEEQFKIWREVDLRLTFKSLQNFS
jgi:hypothetical protein